LATKNTCKVERRIDAMLRSGVAIFDQAAPVSFGLVESVLKLQASRPAKCRNDKAGLQSQ